MEEIVRSLSAMGLANDAPLKFSLRFINNGVTLIIRDIAPGTLLHGQHSAAFGPRYQTPRSAASVLLTVDRYVGRRYV